jgi:hypothetical protein
MALKMRLVMMIASIGLLVHFCKMFCKPPRKKVSSKMAGPKAITINEMIFIGDALFPGGNDYPAKEAGVVSIQVRDPNETKRVSEAIIACLDCIQQP